MAACPGHPDVEAQRPSNPDRRDKPGDDMHREIDLIDVQVEP
jgi:hypothetical protein